VAASTAFSPPRGCAREIPRLARRYQHGKTIPALKAFADAGGTLLAMGSSSSGLAAALRLPVTDPLLTERDGKRVPLSDTRFYVPGAVLTADVNTADPIAWGSAPRWTCSMIPARCSARPRREPRLPSRSARARCCTGGWAWHPEYLKDTAAVLTVPQGKGKVVLVGPEIALRAQTQGAFKILFNAIALSAARPAQTAQGK
jgi:hypothetical protein